MLDHKVQDGVLIVYLKGRLDVSIANEVEENLNDLIDNQGHTRVVLNMQDVDYMSSSGFRACISTLRKLNAKEGGLKICGIKPAVKRIFDVIELTSLFDIRETEDEALKSFRS
ncbi:STAS domain-containing protein [Leptospira inadai]|uniref:Anti-sigma factor antagonist n=1 Tax=Leptospira inadai serovar Lyme TaxID=293084 RepID=A0ABX4YH87_9LEPT|nr:STAS domain-containing protein [Leptospira inadai]PNV74633.1 anti-sigma factor antagonist [Leptospira inadai serovar Lyme]